jgi:hypothetical protein
MKKKIILEDCICLSSCCIFNIDYNCTKQLDNISPSFGTNTFCPSKITIKDIHK